MNRFILILLAALPFSFSAEARLPDPQGWCCMLGSWNWYNDSGVNQKYCWDDLNQQCDYAAPGTTLYNWYPCSQQYACNPTVEPL